MALKCVWVGLVLDIFQTDCEVRPALTLPSADWFSLPEYRDEKFLCTWFG